MKRKLFALKNKQTRRLAMCNGSVMTFDSRIEARAWCFTKADGVEKHSGRRLEEEIVEYKPRKRKTRDFMSKKQRAVAEAVALIDATED